MTSTIISNASKPSDTNEENQLKTIDLKFWLLLLMCIPSVIRSALVFIYFYQKRTRLSLHLHLSLILVSISFVQITTDLSIAMIFYATGQVPIQTESFCLWWNWWDYSISSTMNFVTAWGSIERHFIVFNGLLFSTARRRFLFHYLPLFVFSIYPSIFYLSVIVCNSCENQWNYQMLLCFQPCFLIEQASLATFDFIMNIVFPVLIIVISNFALLCRVLWLKRSHQATWQQKWKLSIRLLYVGFLYAIFWFPLTVNGLVLTFTSSPIALNLQMNYFFFTIYMVPVLLPFTCSSYLKNFQRSLFQKFNMRRLVPLPAIVNQR